jgi:hypothetical protein
MVEIYYNGKNAFSGIAPTPLVGFSSEFLDVGSNWNQVTKINLDGTLTGEFIGKSSYDFLNKSLKGLISNFSENFKTLEIKEDGNTIYTAENVIVESISVPDNRFYGLSPFVVELAIYDPEVYEHNFGVKNPSDEIRYEEDRSGILKYTRTISAAGLSIGPDSPISNAKKWVEWQKWTAPSIDPILVKNNQNQFILVSENEVVDRFNGTYSLVRSYVKDVHAEAIDGVMFTYSIDLSFDEDSGITSAKITGALKNNEPQYLRDKYNSLDLFGKCNDVCFKATGKFLRSRFVSHSVNESDSDRSLNFVVGFNDDESDDIVQDISVSLNYSERECDAQITVSNSISSKFGSKTERWQKVLAAFNSFNSYRYAAEIYEEELGGVLSTNIKSEFIEHNEFDGVISTRTEYGDQRLPFGADEKYVDSMQSEVNYSPSVNAMVPNSSAFFSREHNIQNMGAAPRSSLEISVGIKLKSKTSDSYKLNAESLAFQEIARVKNNYIGSAQKLNKESSVRRWSDNTSFDITEVWSFEGNIYNNI